MPWIAAAATWNASTTAFSGSAPARGPPRVRDLLVGGSQQIAARQCGQVAYDACFDVDLG